MCFRKKQKIAPGNVLEWVGWKIDDQSVAVAPDHNLRRSSGVHWPRTYYDRRSRARWCLLGISRSASSTQLYSDALYSPTDEIRWAYNDGGDRLYTGITQRAAGRPVCSRHAHVAAYIFYTLKPVGIRARAVFTEAEDARRIGPRGF